MAHRWTASDTTGSHHSIDQALTRSTRLLHHEDHRDGAARQSTTYFVALIIFVAGIATFLNFPSQEEPTVTVRDAMVTALNPGLPAERVEQLIARPIEERLRELAEVKRVTSTVRAGSAMIQVTIWDRYTDLAPIWQRVRAKVADSKDALPEHDGAFRRRRLRPRRGCLDCGHCTRLLHERDARRAQADARPPVHRAWY